jgi:hypothetical protein
VSEWGLWKTFLRARVAKDRQSHLLQTTFNEANNVFTFATGDTVFGFFKLFPFRFFASTQIKVKEKILYKNVNFVLKHRLAPFGKCFTFQTRTCIPENPG